MSSLKIVYVLANSAMPGLVKIGYTTQDDANSRIAQLYTTGVPVPFELKYACKVQNAEEVEKALHIAFSPHRINPKREFFKIDPEQAIAILKLLHTEDATSEIERQPTTLDQESVIAAEQLKSKRPNMSFLEMGIPVGSELHYVHGTSTVTVSSAKRVRFNGEEISLTAVTRQLLNIEYSVQPSPYWTYEGKRLKDIYEETYGNVNDI
ncbi:GIY-YIG nuclease family protein [Methyloglobulus sp.]|uniref:GIY-YIG nuclease family protein n=1 Tax=Methyloglobulus sp. TaxID=2518622 RepID=UPI0017B5ACF4|nr:GIY-YIG nuclease family protein [Methyloglobulus sp.]